MRVVGSRVVRAVKVWLMRVSGIGEVGFMVRVMARIVILVEIWVVVGEVEGKVGFCSFCGFCEG